ncbi:MAG: transposase [Nitrososphaeria archaeon]
MRLSYKFRIYPNKQQALQLTSVFNFCRFLYNCSLEERISFYTKYNKSLTYNMQAAELAEVKAAFPEEAEHIYSQTLQAVLKQLDSAYQGFFRRVKNGEDPGFPRFKNAERFRSILFPQCNLKSGGVKRLDNDKIRIYGIPGEVKTVWHRELQGDCKTVRIVKQGEKYFLIASCDNVPVKLLPKTGKTTAIDLGLNSFITDNQGEKFYAPKPYKTAKEKLAYLNRKLANKKRGSNNRKRVKNQLVKAYEKITNIREDFQHKLANKLLTENDTIIIENLNVKKMMESESFTVSKANIMDASWSSFAAKLAYKAERAGKLLIEVNPANTSKTCSGCGKIKEMTLADRTYHCEACGLELDRDHNAALNILRLGMSLAASKDASEASAFRPR